MMIEKMRAADVKDVVTLHIEGFPDSFLTHLGRSFLSVIYQEFIQSGFAYVVHEENELAGFLAGIYTSAEIFYKTLIKKNLLCFLFYLLLVVVQRPSIILPIFQRVNRLFRRNVPVKKIAEPEYNSLMQSGAVIASALTMTVSPRFRGKGIAQKLWSYLLHDLPVQGVEAIIGSVQSDNAATNGLYKKMGFKIIARFERGYVPKEYKWLFYRRNQCSVSETGFVTWC